MKILWSRCLLLMADGREENFLSQRGRLRRLKSNCGRSYPAGVAFIKLCGLSFASRRVRANDESRAIERIIELYRE